MLLVASIFVWWLVIGDLVRAPFSGSVIHIIVALYLIGPFLLGSLFSDIGLLLEVGQPAPSTQ